MPTEEEEQKAFVDWLNAKKYPHHHSPNEGGGGRQNAIRGAKMKRLGMSKGYWDLATNHVQDIIVEEEEEPLENDNLEDEDLMVESENEEEDIFYDNDLEDNDDEDDDLKDLVIIDEDENVQ